jgi:NH3-dependent NAD+ synthetase
MSKSLTADVTVGDDEVEIKAAIGSFLAEIERNREKMQRDQEDIERLKARTRATLAQLEAA